MKKGNDLVKNICEIGIFAAIGYILDEFQSVFFKGVFINGGSIGFAMIAVIIIGYRRGFFSALLTGFIMGLFDMATGAYIIHPAQLLLDYLLSYAVVAVGVLFKPLFDKSEKHKLLILVIGTIVGGLAKLLCHYLSGIFFWANPSQFAWGLTTLSPYIYSLLYNLAFIGPSIVLTTCLVIAIFKKGSKIFNVSTTSITINESKSDWKQYLISISTTIVGVFLFTFYLTKYIKSYESYSSDKEIYYSFSQDSMVIFILGIMLSILGIYLLVRTIKNKFSYDLFEIGISFTSIISLVYSLARLIKVTKKGQNNTIYIIWFITSILILILFIILIILKRRKKS